MIGIIGAMEHEVQLLASRMENSSTRTIGSVKYYIGTIAGQDAVVAACGVGKVAAALCCQTMLHMWQPELVINTGAAGSLSACLHQGDVVVGTEVVQHDMDLTALGFAPGYQMSCDTTFMPCDGEAGKILAGCIEDQGCRVERGIIASGDQFIHTETEKDRIVGTFGAVCCEMEGAAVGQACYMNRVPFLVIRAISDEADGEAAQDYPAFAVTASERSARAVHSFCGKWKK